MAVGEVAVVDLLGVVYAALAWPVGVRLACSCSGVDVCERVQQLTVQLVSVQVLCARVALPTALVRTLELLVQALSTTPALPRGTVAITIAVAVARVAIVLAIASPASVLAAVGRCGGGWLTRSTGGSVHLVSKVRLNLCQIRRVRSMHG